MFPHLLFFAMAGVLLLVAASLGAWARWGGKARFGLTTRIIGPLAVVGLYLTFFSTNMTFRSWVVRALNSMADGLRNYVDSLLPFC